MPAKSDAAEDCPLSRLTVTGLENIAKTAANALVAAVGVTKETDCDTGIHAAVNVSGGKLTVDVVDANNLRLVLGGGGNHPMPLALIAKGALPDFLTPSPSHTGVAS